MGNMDLPVFCHQHVLYADVAVDCDRLKTYSTADQARRFQGDKFAEHRPGDFQDHFGRETAVMEDKIGQRSALDPERGGPQSLAVEAGRLDQPG